MTITDKANPSKRIKILYTEICYNRDYKPYRFLCVEYPLVGGTGIKPSMSREASQEFGIAKPQKPTFQTSKTFLYSKPDSPNVIVMKKAEREFDTFLQETIFNANTEQQVIEDIQRMKEKLMDDLVCACAEYKALQSNEKQMNSLSLLVDCYLLGSLNSLIYQGLKEIYSQKNNYYYERMTILSNLTLDDIGVKKEFAPHLARATDVMIQFQSDVTPIDKLLTIVQASNEIENSIKTSSQFELSDESLTITGDDALPLTSYLIIQAHPRHLESDLIYCTNYIFSNISTMSLGYHLVNFQASIEYIKHLIDQFDIAPPPAQQTGVNTMPPSFLSSQSLLSSYTGANPPLIQHDVLYPPPIPIVGIYNYPSAQSSLSATTTPTGPSSNAQQQQQQQGGVTSPRGPDTKSNNNFQYQKYTKPPSVISLNDDDDDSDPF
ncbi:hypothetical protein SAMD00019534_050290 [Acytostelium subglobosum LB1]|uniref:hypothetical protein n=1 Tax=Acytostelium subglobosum LB1 TaxID=1410327 RepID=UPI000644C422|nr:hypothetical protein SAMD00019534_050290 [Acytostelium subglobosum LB1]GAM21854.1 hypothetical protein SAMD00019534_050290 [Acytostelium subglobosum LB1]|eukprot:XP_012754954.1 hypothetical protein SAMD00019534_050290 [Acytostelium subglobosum LB1]